MSVFDDLKHEFLILTDVIGIDYSVFSETRQREAVHTCNRMRSSVVPDLERAGIDTDDFEFVFKAVEHLVGKIQILEQQQDSSQKEQLRRLHYNLKALVTQVNDQVQSINITEGSG